MFPEEYVCVDLEFSYSDKKNTPPEKRKGSIVEIGIVKVVNGKVTPKEMIVKLIPGREFQKDMPEPYRKDPKKYENGMDPKESMEKLRECVGDLTIVGVDFKDKDMRMIREHREFLDLPPWEPKVFDLYVYSGMSLDRLMNKYSINEKQTHEALNGAKLTYEVFSKIIPELNL